MSWQCFGSKPLWANDYANQTPPKKLTSQKEMVLVWKKLYMWAQHGSRISPFIVLWAWAQAAQALVVADVSEPGASCFDSAQFVISSLEHHGAGLMLTFGCRWRVVLLCVLLLGWGLFGSGHFVIGGRVLSVGLNGTSRDGLMMPWILYSLGIFCYQGGGALWGHHRLRSLGPWHHCCMVG